MLIENFVKQLQEEVNPSIRQEGDCIQYLSIRELTDVEQVTHKFVSKTVAAFGELPEVELGESQKGAALLLFIGNYFSYKKVSFYHDKTQTHRTRWGLIFEYTKAYEAFDIFTAKEGHCKLD